MTAFSTELKAFEHSEISLPQLLAFATKFSEQPETEVNAALALLQNEYQQGRLPEKTYFTLQNALDNKTRIAPSFSPKPIDHPQDDDETRLAINNLINNPSDAATASLLNTEALLNDRDESQAPIPLSVGSIIKGRFVLEELLGVGGMGMVFKAKDLRKVEAADKEPYVALKILNQDFQADPVALIALQRETKRAQTLSHLNIIKVYDFDRDGAHAFMTMEYLQGRPLNHLIREHADSGLSYKQAWPIIQAMAEALGHAHKKNIVHSDFKPGNVFISENGEVRVLDFGIACAIGRSDKDHQDATVFNARTLGAMTPAYASLEQIKNLAPDQRDDIYALACVCYELLTGKHPFGRLSAEKALEVNLQVKPIAKLSHRQWKGLQKALTLQQEQRTADISEFLAAIGPRSKLFYGLWGTGIIVTGLFAANIYLGVIAPPTVVEAPKVTVDISPEQQQKIKDLLELASIHTDVGYLTAPTGSNALWAYQEVLKIDPYNRSATDGINRIADMVEQQAWEAYEKNDRTTALKKIQEGLEANSSHKGLLSLKDKLRASP